MPMLWAMLVLPIHIFGVISMRLRIRRDTEYQRQCGRVDQEESGTWNGFETHQGRLGDYGKQWSRRRWHSRTVVLPLTRNLGLIFPCRGGCHLGSSAISFWGRSWCLASCLSGHWMLCQWPEGCLSVVTCRTIIMYGISGIREVYTIRHLRSRLKYSHLYTYGTCTLPS